MRARIFTLHQRASDWRRLFGGCFLAWLFFDLCVVHLLHPQYAAAELFGCAVPPVVATPSVAADATPGMAAAPAGLEAADRSLPAHSCFWNTQSLLDAPAVALPPPRCFASPSAAIPPAVATRYARLCPGAVFRPPRLA